jgi:hypothetical protein
VAAARVHGRQAHRWGAHEEGALVLLVRRCPVLYGPLAAGSTSLAVVGLFAGWGSSELPLVVLTLPFSVVPILAGAPPSGNVVAGAVIALSMAAAFRWGRSQISDRLIAGMLVLWFAAGALSAGVFVRSHWFGPWPHLRHAVAAFEVPAGFDLVARAETGSEACFVSCDEPRIYLVLTTTLPPAEACGPVESSVRTVARGVDPSPEYLVRPPEAACFLAGDLPQVYSNARLVAAVLTGAGLRAHPWLLAGPVPASIGDGDTVVTLLFNSGID